MVILFNATKKTYRAAKQQLYTGEKLNQRSAEGNKQRSKVLVVREDHENPDKITLEVHGVGRSNS